MTSLRKGSKVWVADSASAWIAAEVVNLVGKQVQVLTSSDEKVMTALCFWINLYVHCLLLRVNMLIRKGRVR